MQLLTVCRWIGCPNAGVANLRPTGRMRLIEGLNVARETSSKKKIQIFASILLKILTCLYKCTVDLILPYTDVCTALHTEHFPSVCE